jgi:hypothetical protein
MLKCYDRRAWTGFVCLRMLTVVTGGAVMNTVSFNVSAHTEIAIIRTNESGGRCDLAK